MGDSYVKSGKSLPNLFAVHSIASLLKLSPSSAYLPYHRYTRRSHVQNSAGQDQQTTQSISSGFSLSGNYTSTKSAVRPLQQHRQHNPATALFRNHSQDDR
jgi:hypothetical protein